MKIASTTLALLALTLALPGQAPAQPSAKTARPPAKASPKTVPVAKTVPDIVPDAKTPAPATKANETPPLAEILRESPEGDWRKLDQTRMLYMSLPRGRVIIELAPAFAPNTVTNIRALARSGFFDDSAIVRVQDNFVVQWGIPDGVPTPFLGAGKAKISPPEFTRPSAGLTFTPLPDRDAYAAQVGFVDGFASARDPKTGRAWLTHCYGTVAVGRDTAQDSGNGGELYAVIGPARHLDRNLTVVGRVVQGMELLSALPRGPGAMGFYSDATARLPLRIRVGSDLPAAQQVSLEALRTDSLTFSKVIEGRRNRRDDFYVNPAGGVDVCNVPLPVRPAATR